MSTVGTRLFAGMASASRRCVVALATLGRRTTQPHAALSADEVRHAITAAERRDPAAGLALRLAAVTGARRAELCALRWTDRDGDRLTQWRLHDLRHWSARKRSGVGTTSVHHIVARHIEHPSPDSHEE